MTRPDDAAARTVYGVIPAGGSGQRLWPLSRAGAPKFLHALSGAGDRSLLQSTVDRFSPLVDIDRVLVVTGALHAAAVADQLPGLPARNLIAEPVPRESGPAIALAAALIHERDPAAVMLSCHADQLVRDIDAFHSAVGTAIEVAATGLLVTIGIAPDAPETGYGYLQLGEPLGIGTARAVRQFREKPDRETAAGYLASGDYLWNAGMFCWRVDAFLEQLAIELPELHGGVTDLAPRWTSAPGSDIQREWSALPKISIDHGLMQPAGARGMVATVPADFGWADIGDWHALGQILGGAEHGHTKLGSGSLVSEDSADCVVVSGFGRTIALLGITGLAVIDTEDVLLVCPRDRAQEVKALVEQAHREGRDSVL
ncbi:MAG: mannose-1-phosphate guanylyltransferase [Geodermatophilaceae bacterium]|nr:mannose-1-phosphate guanylyltransferase [Geodermatophilaceae bacterium]